MFGTSSGDVCKPLQASSTSTGTAGQCGEAVFDASSDDSPSGAGGTGASSIYWSSWIPQTSGSLQGVCNLYDTLPTCVFAMDGAFSFTALSAADPGLAVAPPPGVIAPGPCSSNPCKNGGTCELPNGTCKCPACYSGSKCESEVPDCCALNADCGGHGSCSSNKCTCESGYSGATCETGKCDDVVCQNGGTCKMPEGTCVCPEGYSGPRCETGRCDGVVCQNGGSCKMPDGKCQCPEGYLGTNCEIGVCDNVVCQNGGTCKKPEGKCQCTEGYSGAHCEIGVCDTVVCKNGGTCTIPDGKCKCPDCYTGDHCEIENVRCCKTDDDCNKPKGTCVNNSCQCAPSVTGDKCDNAGCAGVTCLNGGSCEEATVQCRCPPCYTGSNCEMHESNCCVTNTDCNEPNGVCSSSNTCECKPEFPAANCEDVCSNMNCPNGGTCDPATGDCECPPGWGGKLCSEPEPCGKGGETCTGNSTCDPGTSTCVCKFGYTGEDCTDLAAECKETCQVGGDVVRQDASECRLDCYSTCCKHVLEACKNEAPSALPQCVRDKLNEDEDEACCVARVEGRPTAYTVALRGWI